MRSNSIRFTGMASGMDTDSIVKDMMRPQQYKIDNQKKQQALLQLKQDAWKDMNKKLFDFHTKFTEKMSRESTFKKNIVTSSNPNAINIDSEATVPQGTHAFEVSQLAESATLVGKVNVSSDFKTDAETSLSMKVKGTDITVTIEQGASLEDIANAMNEKLKEQGFAASYDKKNGSLFISSKETGWKQSIEFNDSSDQELLEKLGLDNVGLVRGKVAKYSYNGTEFTNASNKIEINGIKATLKAITTGPVTIASEPDTDAIYTWVKDFVKEYNELIDEINLKVGTKPGKDMMPLTAEERDAMSDSEIKLWEEKINNSLFYQDQQLTQFVDSARSILGQLVDVESGKPNSLASLGIVTGSWQEKGKLYIEDADEDSGAPNKLRAAIANDPEGVAKLLNTLGKQLYKEHDTTLRTSNTLKSAMNFYNDKAMTDKIKNFDKQIKTLEERMYAMEDRYYAKFAAMEKMLSTLNNQSSWLAQQFGGY